MAVLGFHHIALCSNDLKKSLAFYEALGGKKIHSFNSISSGKEIDLVELASGAVIEILPREPKGEGTFAHIAIATDNCEELFEIAVKAGAEVQNPVREMMLGTMKVKNAFLYGPDKEIIELFQVL